MITFPDFTWEHIIEYFQWRHDNQQKMIDPNEHESINNYYRRQAQWCEAMLELIPKFRDHPQLKNLIPWRSMWALRWFPADDREIMLDNSANAGEFAVSVLRGHFPEDIVEKKIVSQDEVVDQVYAYILQYDDGLRTEERG